MTNLYTENEVRWLLENFLSASTDKNPDVIVRIADLKSSYRDMPESTRTLLFMCGVQGLDKDTVGFVLDLHRTTVFRQYKLGVTRLTHYMNGEYDEIESEY
jgi:hypothetical protein